MRGRLIRPRHIEMRWKIQVPSIHKHADFPGQNGKKTNNPIIFGGFLISDRIDLDGSYSF
jgi:hypothetical protein